MSLNPRMTCLSFNLRLFLKRSANGWPQLLPNKKPQLADLMRGLHSGKNKTSFVVIGVLSYP